MTLPCCCSRLSSFPATGQWLQCGDGKSRCTLCRMCAFLPSRHKALLHAEKVEVRRQQLMKILAAALFIILLAGEARAQAPAAGV
jgi:hypothetical protein